MLFKNNNGADYLRPYRLPHFVASATVHLSELHKKNMCFASNFRRRIAFSLSHEYLFLFPRERQAFASSP